MSRTRDKPQKDVLSQRKRSRDEKSAEQPSKRVAKEEETTVDDSLRKEQDKIDEQVALQKPEQLVARFTTTIRKYKPDLSTIEVEDQSLPEKVFRDTTGFNNPRNVQYLAQFLQDYTPGGKDELSVCEKESSPHTILIAFSAIRTTELVRAVRDFGSEHNKIAKLFAKHMKLAAMTNYVQKTKFGIGCGTPKRIEDLIQNGALKIQNLKRIVVDASYINDKSNSIFSDRDGFLQTLSLLNVEQLKLRFFSGETEILVF